MCLTIGGNKSKPRIKNGKIRVYKTLGIHKNEDGVILFHSPFRGGIIHHGINKSNRIFSKLTEEEKIRKDVEYGFHCFLSLSEAIDDSNEWVKYTVVVGCDIFKRDVIAVGQFDNTSGSLFTAQKPGLKDSLVCMKMSVDLKRIFHFNNSVSCHWKDIPKSY